MQTLRVKSAAVASLVLLVEAAASITPGHATVFDITFTGIVSSFVDTTGAYGVPGADLAGKPFTNSYVIDTSSASFSSGPFGSGLYTMYSANLPSGLNAASSTINGHTITFNSNLFDYRERLTSPNPYDFSLQEAQAEGFDWLYANASGYSYQVTVLRDEPLTYSQSIPLSLVPYSLAIDNVNGPIYGSGSFQIFIVAYDYASQTVTQTYNVGYFDEKFVTVSARAAGPGLATPVPPAWIMMANGLVALVLAARARKGKTLRGHNG